MRTHDARSATRGRRPAGFSTAGADRGGGPIRCPARVLALSPIAVPAPWLESSPISGDGDRGLPLSWTIGIARRSIMSCETHQRSRGMSTGSDIEFMYMESLRAIGATIARRKQKVLGPVCGWFDQRGSTMTRSPPQNRSRHRESPHDVPQKTGQEIGMLFTSTTTHMPAIEWRLCVDSVEIVWRCTCAIRWTPTPLMLCSSLNS